MLPGGGLERGEDAMCAAVRELREETACPLDDPVQIATIEETIHGAGNTVHVIAGWTQGTPRADGREILEAAFFALHQLPEAMPDPLRQGLPGWITTRKAVRPRDEVRVPSHPPAPKA